MDRQDSLAALGFANRVAPRRAALGLLVRGAKRGSGSCRRLCVGDCCRRHDCVKAVKAIGKLKSSKKSKRVCSDKVQALALFACPSVLSGEHRLRPRLGSSIRKAQAVRVERLWQSFGVLSWRERPSQVVLAPADEEAWRRVYAVAAS